MQTEAQRKERKKRCYVAYLFPGSESVPLQQHELRGGYAGLTYGATGGLGERRIEEVSTEEGAPPLSHCRAEAGSGGGVLWVVRCRRVPAQSVSLYRIYKRLSLL